jgi:uncharacterized protein involved in exopolysaccharide biosynthesis
MMELRPGVRVLRSFWLPIIVSGLLAAGIAYAASYAFSTRYTATTSLLIRGRDGRVLSSTGQSLVGQMAADASWAKTLVQTYGTLIQSRPIAEQVVRELHLDQPRPPETSQWKIYRSQIKHLYQVGLAYVKYGFYVEPPAFEGAVDSVQQNLSAAPVKDSMIVIISANADDPDQAAAIANSATQGLIQSINARTRSSAQDNREYLKSQVDAMQSGLADAEAAVRKYREQNGITDLTEQAKTVLGALDTNRRDRETAANNVADAKARVDALNSALDKIDAEEQTRVRVRAGTGADTDTTGPNSLYRDMRKSLETARAELAGLETRTAALDDSRKDLEARVAQLPVQAARLASLNADVEAARARLRDAQNAFDSAIRGDAPGAEEVSLIDSAVPPLYPVRPLRYIFALLGLVCGMSLTTIAAFVIDALRMSRLRQERALLRLSAPMVVAVSRGASPSRYARQAAATSGRNGTGGVAHGAADDQRRRNDGGDAL